MMKIFKTMIPVLILSLISYITAATAEYNADHNKDLYSSKDAAKASVPVPHNRVHRAGLFWMNMTNMGYFGNPNNLKEPCTGKTAVSGELPGGSGTDFLFVGGLNFGGYLDSADVTVDGEPAKIFQGPLVSTAYEGWTGAGGPSYMPMELWPINFEDDPSGSTLGRVVESSNVEGKISCLFEEVYDPKATAEEQFSVMYTDKFVQRSPFTGECDYDQRDHIPLGIEIRQKSYAWSYDYAQKFIIIDYTLYNRNESGADIYDFFMGVYLDPDIGHTSGTLPAGGNITDNHGDDMGGFIQKWEYYDDATESMQVADLNLAWAADNDGRNYVGNYNPSMEPGAGEPLDGATSIATVRVLRNPNPNLRFAYNIYIADSDYENIDWGPRWQTGLHPRPVEDHPDDPAHDSRAVPWQYDLTMKQKGYDDTNHDELMVNGNNGSRPLAGGRTEGRPAGDRGRYMVMSNDEFDYDQIDIREVYLDVYEEPDYVQGTPFEQADKWQKWTTEDEIGEPGHATGIEDGSIESMNDIANGRDVKSVLSFGPLGFEDYVNVAWNPSETNGEPQDVIRNKKVWRFENQDSLKLTLAFIVNENFHTSLEQDPNYADESVVDLSDGLNKSLYDKGWFDALYNVVWAERVYDIPMYDTYVTVNGETKGDGWYGEDVGADAMFGDIKNDTFCWWIGEEYLGPDEGEGDFEITDFTVPVTDVYGHVAESEDELLPFGREQEDEDGVYGITGTQADGDKNAFGYMVKYDKYDGAVPQNTWVRFGYDNDKIDVGDGVPDFTGPPPPPSPNINIIYDNDNVIVEWQSHEFFYTDSTNTHESYLGPEHFIDPFTRSKDFEGYQLQISPDLNSQNYTEIFSVDTENYIYENVSEPGEYLDAPFNKTERDSLIGIGEQIHPENPEGKIWSIVPYGDNRSMYESHSQPGIYTYSAEQSQREILNTEDELENVEYWKYRFVLHNRLLAKQNYVAVTASDFGDPQSGTPALKSNPSVNGMSVIPTRLTNTSDVVVVPNPYRGDEDYESMGWENVDQSDLWQEQDRKIVFMNVPYKSVVKIYTLAGDLVKTIGHNGSARVDERYHYGEYGVSWDLINENNQAVASGIYLYSVKDLEDDGYEHIGKFVIIK